MTTRALAAIGGAVFAVTLIATAPVALLYAWFAPAESRVVLHGLEGTLGRGAVSAISVNQKPVWSELRWQLRPLGLLFAQASFDVQGTGVATLKSRLRLSPLGGVHLRNTEAGGSLKALLLAVGQGYLPVEGQVQAVLDELSFADGRPRSAEGIVDVQRLAWTLARDPVLLGDYRATLATADGEIRAQVVSIAGPLDVSGNLRLLPAADGGQLYALDLLIKLQPGAPPVLQTLVQSLGAPDAQGRYAIKRQGPLPKA